MSNEAAERLHEHLCVIYEEARPIKNMVELQQLARDDLQAALLAERKATVERIRAAIDEDQSLGIEMASKELDAILDAEAAR